MGNSSGRNSHQSNITILVSLHNNVSDNNSSSRTRFTTEVPPVRQDSRVKIQKTLLSIYNITLQTEIVLQLQSKMTVIILVSHNVYG